MPLSSLCWASALNGSGGHAPMGLWILLSLAYRLS